MALQARVNVSIEVDKTVNAELFLHLKIYVAHFALELELILVFVGDVVMVVSRHSAGEHSCAEFTLEREIVGML